MRTTIQFARLHFEVCMDQTELTLTEVTEDGEVADNPKVKSLMAPVTSGVIYNPLERLPLKWDPPQEEEF